MAGKLKGAKDGVPFKKGKDPRRNLSGRPVKFFTTMKQAGYKPVEVTDCIQAMLGYTVEQLQEIMNEKEDATVLEKGVAKLLFNFVITGDTTDLDTLFHRAWGAPKHQVEHSGEVKTNAPVINILPLRGSKPTSE